MSSAQQTKDYDVVVAATSPTYAWIFPFGTIAAAGVETGYTIKALEAKRKAEQAERDYADEVKAELALTKLSNWVSHLGTTFHNLDKAMDDAIKSLAAIQDMFNQQSKSFALISADLGDAEGAFNKRWAVRKRALNKFSECYKEWQQVSRRALSSHYWHCGIPLRVAVLISSPCRSWSWQTSSWPPRRSLSLARKQQNLLVTLSLCRVLCLRETNEKSFSWDCSRWCS